MVVRMPITDYSGIEGFCVQVESAQDVYDALDRMHTQLLDLIEPAEEYTREHEGEVLGSSPFKYRRAKARIEQLRPTQRILEKAMEELLDLEGVRG